MRPGRGRTYILRRDHAESLEISAGKEGLMGRFLRKSFDTSLATGQSSETLLTRAPSVTITMHCLPETSPEVRVACDIKLPPSVDTAQHTRHSNAVHRTHR